MGQLRGARSQAGEILLDPGGVLALLEDVPGQVFAHAGTYGIRRPALGLVQGGLHQWRAGARKAMRAKQQLRIELRHIKVVHNLVARVAEL